jgi:hypothetical protein
MQPHPVILNYGLGTAKTEEKLEKKQEIWQLLRASFDKRIKL